MPLRGCPSGTPACLLVRVDISEMNTNLFGFKGESRPGDFTVAKRSEIASRLGP